MAHVECRTRAGGPLASKWHLSIGSAEQGEQARVRRGVEFGRWATAVGFGLDRSRAAFALEEADEERHADGEQVGAFVERIVAALDGGHDAFPKVVGIGAHGRISSWAYPEVFYS